MHLIAEIRNDDVSRIQRVALVCGNDPTRPVLHHLEISPSGACGLVFAATNGVSLACAKLSVPFPHGLLAPIYLTPSAVSAIKKIKINKKTNTMLGIYLDNGKYSIVIDQDGNKTQVQATNDLRFPSWKKVIPSGCLQRPGSFLFDDDAATLGTKVLSHDDKHKFYFTSTCLTEHGISRGIAVAYNDGIMFAAMPLIAPELSDEHIEMVSKCLLDFVNPL